MFGRKRTERDGMWQMEEEKIRPERRVPELATLVRTATGNRKYQQDAAYVTPSRILAANKKTRILAIVCDGMGGMADGGRASQTAIQMMVQGFQRVEKSARLDIPAFFRQGIRAIDQAIYQFPRENGRGSGTTMAACIAEDNQLYWASVGDSRIYIIRRGQMRQVTRDHNYRLVLEEMIANGRMTREEAEAQRQKEALVSFLGIGNVNLMDINTSPFTMEYGDTIMLCSDGITKTLPDAQIKRILTDDAVKPEQKAEALVEAATHINSYSQDNTTAALIHFHEKEIKSIERRF